MSGLVQAEGRKPILVSGRHPDTPRGPSSAPRMGRTLNKKPVSPPDTGFLLFAFLRQQKTEVPAFAGMWVGISCDLSVIVNTRLVRAIHLSAGAAAWIARTSRAMTMEGVVRVRLKSPKGSFQGH